MNLKTLSLMQEKTPQVSIQKIDNAKNKKHQEGK